MSTMTQAPVEAPDAARRIIAPLEDVVCRAAGDGESITLEGYAAVFDTTTTLFEGRSLVWREVVRRGAFVDAINRAGRDGAPHVVLNFEHDNAYAIARTGVDGLGRLELSEDERGLRVWARLNSDDPHVQLLRAKAGFYNGMSFRCTVDELHTTIEELDDRTLETDEILRVKKLIDVCVCAQGAYTDAHAELIERARTREAAAAQRRESSAPTVASGPDGAGGRDMRSGHQEASRADEADPPSDGRVTEVTDRRRRKLELRARAALARFPILERGPSDASSD